MRFFKNDMEENTMERGRMPKANNVMKAAFGALGREVA